MRKKPRFTNWSFALMAAAVIGWIAPIHAEDTQRTTAKSSVNQVFKIVSPRELLEQPRLKSNHPLVPALEIALERYAYISDNVRDYTCMIAKRERLDGQLGPYEHIFVKFRDERVQDGKVITPFSVYMKFLAPKSIEGREVLYVKGHNDGDVLVRKGGQRTSYIDLWLEPEGRMAMRDNHYPITEFGMKNMVARLIEIAQEDMRYGECQVDITKNVKLDGQSCTAIEVRHPVRRDYFRFHLARILIDDASQLPVHYSAYSWPENPGEGPQLIEEYTYRKLRINVGLTDQDFSRQNPKYGFRKT